ncbi:MAG: hypothetical protein IKK10_03625 [Clostridia bacterium]|nr:hypothetical protein [Clostridia bacterium]
MAYVGYEGMYEKIFKIMGDLTPLKADCGKLCGGACCKGDENTGMRLFPFEESELPVKTLENGVRLVVCNGKCDRTKRPLACRIFPFFPTVDDKGKVYVEPDFRGVRLCPMITHSDEIVFNKQFFKALKKVGKILAKDETCLEFLKESTKEIDTYKDFLL